MSSRWIPGNRFRLLENGEEFFPAVFDAIGAARREVLIETFILFEDKVGLALHAALLDAAKRGVHVELMVDGWGSPSLSAGFVESLTSAGVRFHVFEPAAWLFGMRVNAFRRMHRKIVVVDGERAFVGGINYSADHLLDFGPQAKQDYAVEAQGPIVDEIREFALQSFGPERRLRRWLRWRKRSAPHASPATASANGSARAAGSAEALFVSRDNQRHRHDIERLYRIAFRTAQREIIVANAYFFPGYRFLRDMRRAARRGVAVHLIVQGEPDMPIVKIAARLLYEHLLRAGVRIYEYCERPLHGKVALADDEWATVGSSNLDPLSLSLNLEANVVIRDREFNTALRERLQPLLRDRCTEVQLAKTRRSAWWRATFGAVVFHFLRHFPRWAGALPEHRPKIDVRETGSDDGSGSTPGSAQGSAR